MAIDVALQLLLGIAPVAQDLVKDYRKRRAAGRGGPPPVGPGEGSPTAAPVVPVGVAPVPPLPADWARWFGARPEPRGAPENTILAVSGLYKMPPAFRAGLLTLCAELGIPVDALAAVISSEAGFKPEAMNPLPAAGLIQLTLGAHLPGFDTKDKIRAIATWSPEQQLDQVIGPYYRRFGAKVAAGTPGKLYMLNFLPAHANEGEAFILGTRDADKTPDAANAAPEVQSKLRFSAAVYRENRGFDRAGKGTITVGDVFASIAKTCALAKGHRLAVDGTVVDPPQTSAPPGKNGSSP